MIKIIGLFSVFVFFFASKYSVDTKMKCNRIQTIDTHFSKGRLGDVHYISLEDLEKFQGHLCHGLVVGYRAALKEQYPEVSIDRTNTRTVSKSSPYLTDTAVYMIGGRYQFNTFYVTNDIEGLSVVRRTDNQKAEMANFKRYVELRLLTASTAWL